MKTFESYPLYPNVFDVQNGVWYRSEGPYVNTLFIRVKIGRKLKTASVYMPKDGKAPHALFNGYRPIDDVSTDPKSGMAVEQLMAWCEEKMGLNK